MALPANGPDDIRRLRDIAYELDLNLPETTSMVNKDKRQKRPTFLAKVKIGDQSWTSHPATLFSAEEAEAVAVQKALRELSAKRDLLKNGSAVTLKDGEKQTLIANIVKIIAEQPDGAKLMLHNAVAESYMSRFKTPLPKNWIDLISESDRQLVVERQQLNKGIILIGLPKAAISTRLVKPNGSAVVPEAGSISLNNNAAPLVMPRTKPTPQTAINPLRQSANNGNSGNVITVNSQQLNNANGSGDDVFKSGKTIPPAVLPKVQPQPKADGDYFDVFVVYAATPSNFYVQAYESILPNSLFSKMTRDMQEFYGSDENKIELNPDLLASSIYVAAKYSNNWCRVRIETVMGNKNSTNFQLMCLFVDYGELHVVELADVQPLYTQFRDLPRQAIRASLANIEPVSKDWDVLATFEYSKMVDGRSFVATVHGIEWSTDYGGGDEKRPTLKLSLCDTSQEMDVFMDQVLVKKNFAKLTIVN